MVAVQSRSRIDLESKWRINTASLDSIRINYLLGFVQRIGNDMLIKPYRPGYAKAVTSLWRKCGLLRTQNNLEKDIERKLKVDPELFLVGFIDGKIVASVMGGYEGHRGWMNYLAVDQDYRGKGLGKQIVAEVQEKLETLGCPKINV